MGAKESLCCEKAGRGMSREMKGKMNAEDFEDYEGYEEAMMRCSSLFARAEQVESEENREAVRLVQPILRFAGLEMKRLDHARGIVLQALRFTEMAEADPARPQEYRYEEDDGVCAVYTVYPARGQAAWDARELRRIKYFVLQLYLTNERQNLKHDAHYYRYHDPQTRHHNMAYFLDRCDAYIQRGTIGQYTAILANISGFTNLNFLIGSSNCDTVLIRLLDWLQEGLEKDEVVSRVSGDEFALLIHRSHEGMILEKLRVSDVRYGKHPGDLARVSAEAGIFRLSDAVESYHHIVQAVSSALNVAKSSLQLQFSYYDPIAADAGERRKFYENAFERALINEDIRIFFQPKVSLKDYSLIGAEALSRWMMNGKIVPPDAFIPILEETTRICELDFYVLEHVCRSIRGWLRQGIKPVKVSVNFSRRHLSNTNLVNDIVDVIDRFFVPHHYIEVELTETTIDADFAALKRIVYGLREQGIESSVDDFGMGYSSLSLIRDVPFKVLKIDKSFLGDKKGGPNERKRAMMKHVISMANELGMECIAEGVESMEHVQLLKENKCYMAQGFLFNRPVPKEEFEQILTQAG